MGVIAQEDGNGNLLRLRAALSLFLPIRLELGALVGRRTAEEKGGHF
jgi:hypothetical protein